MAVNISAWVSAFRLRTLPLALSSIIMGTFLAGDEGMFRLSIFLLCLLTTVLLQILSNLANDYGDSVHGADGDHRQGPARAVQSGQISPKAMKLAMLFFGIASLLSGLSLLIIAFPGQWQSFLVFLVLGIAAIAAAIKYTAGKNPYGYKGLGDLFVFLFFGLVGVIGTYYLYLQSWHWPVVLPAISCGLFATAVLNINNIRDIDSDRQSGKMSIPVRIGRPKAVVYHWFILAGGFCAAAFYSIIEYQSYFQWVFLLVSPLLLVNARAVKNKTEPKELDPYLKQMALTTLLFVILFGLGLIFS